MRDTYDIPNVEIFATGKHHGFPFTDEVVAQIVADTNAQVGREPFLRVGHSKDDEPDDGSPRVGAFKNLRYIAGKIVADIVNVPAKVYDAIMHGALPKRSVELVRDFRDKEGNVIPWLIDSVALLGAAHPEVKNLNDLGSLYATEDGYHRLAVFSETGWPRLEKEDMAEEAMVTEEVIETDEKTEVETEAPAIEPDDEADRLAELESENERLRAELEAATASDQEDQDEAAKMAERITDLEVENVILKFQDRIPPADRPALKAKLKKFRKIDGSMKFGEKESLYSECIKEMEARPTVRFGEDNGPGTPPEAGAASDPTDEQLASWGTTKEAWAKLPESDRKDIRSAM